MAVGQLSVKPCRPVQILQELYSRPLLPGDLVDMDIQDCLFTRFNGLQISIFFLICRQPGKGLPAYQGMGLGKGDPPQDFRVPGIFKSSDCGNPVGRNILPQGRGFYNIRVFFYPEYRQGIFTVFGKIIL